MSNADTEKNKESVSNGNPDFTLPTTLATLFIDSIGQEVQVWNDANKDAKSGLPKFFVPPFLLPDWEGFKKQLDQLSSESGDKTATLNLRIRLTSRDYFEDCRRAIQSHLKMDIHDGQVGIVPHSFWEIKIKADGAGTVARSRNIDDLKSHVAAVNTRVNDVVETSVTAQLSHLQGLYEKRGVVGVVDGYLYYRAPEVKSDSFFVSLSDIFGSATRSSLLGNGPA